MKGDFSKAADDIKKKVQENESQWSELVSHLVDKLTGKDLAVTYEFNDLQIDIPRATGPDGKEIGSAKWKINGKFVISTEVQDKSKFSGR